MPKKINDYDYLHLSARIHAMEDHMLTTERVERMLSAHTAEEASKVIGECGYEEISTLTPTGIESVLGRARQSFFADMRKAAPNPALVEVFCIKYDYHNAKTLIKAEAMEADPEPLLLDAGSYPVATLREDYLKADFQHGSELFRRAIARAKEVLAASGDPQSADIVLDAAYYQELLAAAQAANSPFLVGYVRLSIDAANLRSAVRAGRMGQESEFLQRVLVPGGTLSVALVAAAASGGDLAGRYVRTPLEAAAEAGGRALAGGPLTEFERLCDNAITAYLAQGKRVPFGEQSVLGYLYAREAELTTIRIILTGKLAGLETDILRERLRDSYV